MTILESCLLGILQGLTEFLPVSSSGHLVLAETWMNYKASEFLGFDLLLHLATLLAICFYFRKRLLELAAACLPPYSSQNVSPETIDNRKLIFALLVSTFVTVVIGLTFKDFFEQIRDHLGAIGGSFLFTGGLLLATLWAKHGQDDEPGHFPMNLWMFAVIIGAAQGLAILPGVSRSGSTVCMALLLGVSKEKAVEYSFLMSIPAILLASAYELVFKGAALGGVSLFPALLGFLCSLLSGIVFLWMLVWIVKKGQLHQFAFYTIPLGLLVLSYYFLAVEFM